MNVLAITKAGPGAPNIWLEVKVKDMSSTLFIQTSLICKNIKLIIPDISSNQAGIHAREWIAPAVATFIVRELVEDYAEHPDYIDKINW